MSAQDVQDWIGKQIAGNDVVLFMKGTKTMPQCGFSMQVAQILNHLGVEVMSTDEVAAHQARLTDEGLAPVDESGTCCFAKQDKVWVDGPDGAWEIYTVLADSETFGQPSIHVDDSGDSLCCESVPESAARCC